ncbi:MAG: hypothetical protein KGO46_08335, partial [Bacteroidetes bacterium]|nr:hypothetical protein [Bacteroidota bacterium]
TFRTQRRCHGQSLLNGIEQRLPKRGIHAAEKQDYRTNKLSQACVKAQHLHPVSLLQLAPRHKC